ncbi:PREDICTED: glial cell line-derived neurotrophic factor-like [Nanorana parkeri]|uniref:glial cell line-derived neurotrophic factor-like n=1 Tax=Nanorana parkeri TaxID=125878 RepID=UPI000854C82F|nr:PREDICTED: glial cell line-derived neurotrophic factor-like [Nanorana parkeri]
MLGFALGDLTVTLQHRRRNQIQISNQPQGRIVHYGRVCGEDRLKLAGKEYYEWSAADETSAQRNARLTAVWEPQQAERSSTERGSNQNLIHDRTTPFMGRGSLCVTPPPWSCKVTLWTLLVSLLLLLSFMATTVSSTPIMEGPPNEESDTLAVPDPRSTEFVVEEDIDVSIKTTWTSIYENATLEGHNDDELMGVRRLERSPEASARTKKNKKSGNRGKDKNSDGEKGCSRQSLRVRVRDLGLGFDSEEWITFFYCSGSCQQHRNNYDVTLTSLLKHKRIAHSAHGRVSNHPCCRPTSYENVAFMDVTNNWQIVPKLSAANCSCVR